MFPWKETSSQGIMISRAKILHLRVGSLLPMAQTKVTSIRPRGTQLFSSLSLFQLGKATTLTPTTTRLPRTAGLTHAKAFSSKTLASLEPSRPLGAWTPEKRGTRMMLQPTVGRLQMRARKSHCRQNYSEECEAGVNRQINLELYAGYVYLAMAHHFERDDVALPGFARFFQKLFKEEVEHANKLMKYQNMRGGRIVLQDITKPEMDSWTSGLEAVSFALNLEKHVNKSLLGLHNLAESKQDGQFEDFLEDEFLSDQVESIKQLADFVTQLTRCGPGLGEYVFDVETLQEDKGK